MALTVQMLQATSPGGEVGEDVAGSLGRWARVEFRMLLCAPCPSSAPLFSLAPWGFNEGTLCVI